MAEQSRFFDDLDVPVKVLKRPTASTSRSSDGEDLSGGVMLTMAASPGGDSVPWHKVQNHADCGDGQWAVVKDSDGEVEGCHDTEESANRQIAALYASEKDNGEDMTATGVTAAGADDSGACEEGYVRVGDGSCITQEEFDRKSKWRGVLVVEGVTTGDGREFSPNALEWDENALLRWQKEGAHGGQHDVTVSVGRIDRVWRDGNQVWGEGIIDLRNPDGWELARRLDEGFAGGISIDADNIAQPDIEVVWPESPDGQERDDETNQLMMLFGHPEKIIFHGGRVRAATLVDIPAFVEARIGLISNDTSATAPIQVTESFALARHVTATTDASWSVTEKIGRDRPRGAYAWATETLGMFLHHDVDGDDVGAANVTACAAGIARLNEFLGVVPEDDARAVYEHLAGHLRDAGLSPMPFKDADVVLASGVDESTVWRPPAIWFSDPGLTVPVGITVTDQGRVYGHAAQWGECHVGYTDLCITPPVEDQHPYFMTGEVLCDDNSRIAVGQITVGTGHAPLSYQARRAAEHYDNTGAVVADVAVGNDSIGIWVAGAVRPNASQSRVHELRAAGRVSGDWRRIGGELRLVGLLGVNVAGFPLHTRARVASGVPTSLVAAGFMTVGNVMSKPEQDSAALRHVMGMLQERIHGKENHNV
jgi:hypothetical protein